MIVCGTEIPFEKIANLMSIPANEEWAQNR